MAGGLSDELDLKTKEVQEYRQKIGPEKFDAFTAKYAWLDPGKFVSHAAPATVFRKISFAGARTRIRSAGERA